MTDPLLQIRDLSVAYITDKGPLTAVDGVSFDLMPGEIMGLAGESGSGKSTLVHAILRTLGPPGVITGGSALLTHGGVRQDLLSLEGEALRRVRWRQVAMVFQSAMNALNPVMTVGEQLVDTLRAHRRMKVDVARARAAELLRLVDIDPGRMGSYSFELSGGMRQRVVIAMALALQPPLLIMDEPTTALDVVVEGEILKRLLTLKDALGLSILFITHDLPLMLEVTDRVGILYGGRLVEVAPTQQIKASPAHPYTRGLMSAYPSLFAPREDLKQLKGIPGSPPSLASLPQGCRFHPRCALATDRCRKEPPPLLPAATATQAAVACWERQ